MLISLTLKTDNDVFILYNAQQCLFHSCWFNQDMEFLFLTVPQLGYILVGIVVYVMLVITNITAKEGARVSRNLGFCCLNLLLLQAVVNEMSVVTL